MASAASPGSAVDLGPVLGPTHLAGFAMLLHPVALVDVWTGDREFPLAQLWANAAWLTLWNKPNLAAFQA